MSRIGVAVGVVVACAAAGCVLDDELELSPSSAPIVGGSPDPHHPAVVAWIVSGQQCTGTLVAPNVVLSAAHCLPDDEVARGTVFFGSDLSTPTNTRGVAQAIRHRRYDPTTIAANGLLYDIALVRLLYDAPDDIEPMAMNFAPLSQSLIGDDILAVGFGNSDGQASTGAGIKRRALMPINEIGPLLIGSGSDLANTCQGDSGGPMILELDGTERVVGTVSTGPAGCAGNSHQTRVDAFEEDFIIPVLDAWSGPCRFDGTCDPSVECPRTPDPDCDPCQVDGFCARGCPRLDLDCPLAGFEGDACADDDDCESRLCVQALDDPRASYCSQTCESPSDDAADCAAPLSKCVTNQAVGEPVCHYAGATPGTQGTSCSHGGDCRSGICDRRSFICVERCDDPQTVCDGAFVCDEVADLEICTLPPNGGGCRVALSREGGGAEGLLLFAAAVIFARRRRTSRRDS